MLCQSWAASLSSEELDRRAWAWYVHVRQDVHDGVSSWGQKGPVPLSKHVKPKKTFLICFHLIPFRLSI